MNFSNRLGRSAAMAGVAFAALTAGEAYAQSAAASAPADAAPAYNEIVVTATKRAERLQDVPASVSVVTTEDLTKQGAVRFSDYSAKVPGLSLTSGRTGNAQITLRGITTGAAQPGSTTGYYVDEAPVGSVNAYTGGSGITPDLDPSDIAQIEVLKGPQGTLYGAGAVGGLLKFSTAKPSLDEFQGSASAGVTTVSKGEVGYSARGMVNVPLSPGGLALHVSGFYRKDGGFIDNVNARIGAKDINETRVRGGRAVLAAQLGPHVDLKISALLQDTTSDGNNLTDVDALTLKPLYGDLTANRNVREKGDVRLRLYNATWTANFDNVNLVSSTTYQRISFTEIGDSTRSFGAALVGSRALIGLLTGLAIPTDLGIQLNTIKTTERWSQESRINVTDVGGLLDLQGGFYWTHESDTNRIPSADYFSTTTGAAVALPSFVVASIDSSYEEYSFFGNARLHLGDKFDILGGVRQSHDKQNYVQDYRGLFISLATGAIATGARTATLAAVGKESANVTTWLVSPRYKFSDNFMIYGRVATGYRPGGPNPAPPTGNIPLTFDPDKLTQYEAGFKASALDRRLSLEGALFYTDWKHVQIQTSGGGFNYLVNGGKAKSQGGELTLRYRPLEGLSVGANLSYIDAKLTEAAPAAGGLKGDRLPYVPRWSGSVSADYALPIGSNLNATFGGSVNFVSDRMSDYTGAIGAAPRFARRLPAYATVDLRAGIESGNMSLSVFAKNLTDKRAINVLGFSGLAPSNTAGVTSFASYIQPRMIGAEAAIKF